MLFVILNFLSTSEG